MAFARRDEIYEYLTHGEDHNHTYGNFTYDGELDNDIMNVLKTLNKEHLFYDKLAEKVNLDKNYVQFILHYLSYLDFVDYGTSPRGAWVSEEGKQYLERETNGIS